MFKHKLILMVSGLMLMVDGLKVELDPITASERQA